MKTEAVLLYIQPFQSLKVSHFEESLPDLSFVMFCDSSGVPLPDTFILEASAPHC